MDNNSIVAVFDFDGTLTYKDSLFPFLHLVVGKWRFVWGMICISPILLGYSLKLIPNWRAKEMVLKHFLQGLSKEHLQKLGERFATVHIPQLLRSEAVKRLHWHQTQGHQTILISASLEDYIIPWSKSMGFNYAMGTNLVIKQGYITGKILGKNCYGSEKTKRLKDLLGDLNQYSIYAYGDSKGDRELLAIANYPFYQKFSEN
ncbi:HAD-IB family hydrolase [Aphanothece sacrum]|nr:HAD-IB family hydrolase [Aphanothece sacrum]